MAKLCRHLSLRPLPPDADCVKWILPRSCVCLEYKRRYLVTRNNVLCIESEWPKLSEE